MTVDQGGYPPETGSARTLGDTFRATRVSAGVSVEQVESDLRIKAKYIEAIEDGDTVALPSRAYTDGFLRNYATYLGMDPADAVRRFAAEQGLSAPKSRIAPVSPMPKGKGKKSNSLSGYASPEPRRGVFALFGRGVAAAMPLFLVVGLGFGGYTGFVAARDAGLIPPQLGGEPKAAADASEPTAGDKDPKSTRAAEVAAPKKPENSEVAQTSDTRSGDNSTTKTVEAEADLVGGETSTGRPASLTYARSGNTPYWQAKPPAVEPADGPVSEIEPEDAGLLRAEAPVEDEEEQKPSRWSSSGATDTAPADVDASRIAAAAREALAGLTSAPETPAEPIESVAAATEPSESEPAETVTAETVTAATDRAPSAAPEVAVTEPSPVQETQVASLAPIETIPATPEFGIGPVIVEGQPTDLSPIQPQEAPRRFALIAGADTWVQITDLGGNVTYTGILSPGEAYNIPAEQGLRLKTGNAGGLFIEVDGQRFGPLGSSGAVMRNVVLSPGAVRASFTLSQAASLQQ